jgi:hypothetical protein
MMNARLAMAAFGLSVAMVGCGEDDVSAPALTPLPFTVDLEPIGDAEGSGTGSFVFTTGSSPFFDPNSDDRKIVTYSVTVGDLSGDAVAAHIHGPADENSSADILVPLTITNQDSVGLITQGTFTFTTNSAVSMDSLFTLLSNGSAYVDIHTAAFPNGEIRGQIRSR